MGNDEPSTCIHSLTHSSFLACHSSCGGISQVIAGWLIMAGTAALVLLDEDEEEDEEEEEALDGSKASEEADR